MSTRQHAASYLLYLLLALAASGCGKSPEAHYEQGQALFAKGDSQGAILELKNTLQAQPENGEARLLLGQTYLAIEDYANATKELQRARQNGIAEERVLPLLAKSILRQSEPQKVLDLGIPPGSLNRRDLARMQAIRAEAFMQLGKEGESRLAIRAAEEADERNPELLVFKARLAIQNHAFDVAMQFINDALSIDPAFVHAYYLKASIEESKGMLKEALQTYRQALQHDPKAFRANLAIAHTELRLNNMEASEKALQAAERSAPNHLLVRHARGIFELRRGKLKAAEEALQQSLRIAPDYLPSKLALAMVHLGLGHHEQSIKLAEYVLGQKPGDMVAARILSANQLQSGSPRDALATLVPMLDTNSADSRSLLLVGAAHLQNQDYQQALQAFRRAESLDPDNPLIKQQTAAGLLAIGQTELAETALEEAVKLSGEASNADFALIGLQLLRKQFDRALASIDALEKKMPGSPAPFNLRAVALLGQNDTAGARKSLEQALKKDPAFFPAAVNLARLDLAEGQAASAEKRFKDLLEKDNKNLPTMLAMAELAQIRGQDTKSLDWLEKASKAHPKAPQPRAILVQHHLNKGNVAKALEVARNAVTENPDNPLIMEILGSTQLAANDISAAVATYEQLVRKAPQSAQAHLRLGVAQIAAQNPTKAHASLDQALKLEPGFTPAMDAQARLAMTEKKPDVALQWVKKIQAAQARSPMGFEREGDIHMAQQRYTQAAKAYQTSLDKAASTRGTIKLHTALAKAGDIKTAFDKLEGWVKAHPRDLNARTYLASQLAEAGKPSLAIAQYEEVLRLNSQNVLALNELALLYQKSKDARALATAEKALKLAPEHPGIQDTAGWIVAEQGQVSRALKLLQTAAAKAPKSGAVRYHYAAVLAQAGKRAEAKKELEAAIATGQKFAELDAAKSLLKTLP